MATEEEELIIPPHWTQDLGPNSAYIKEMYALYRQDPSLVGDTWSDYFAANESMHSSEPAQGITHQQVAHSNHNNTNGSQQNSQQSTSTSNAAQRAHTTSSSSNGGLSGYYTEPAQEAAVQERVYRMISAFRGRGHFNAKINPLSKGVKPLPFVDDVQIDFYHYTEEQLSNSYNCSGLGQREYLPLSDIISQLQAAYCGPIGFEFTHLLNQRERLWLQERIECRFQSGYRLSNKQKVHRLKKTIEAESFESELHKKFVGQKRFSLQGAETLIPMLDTLLEEAIEEGIKEVIFGMAHRGRLNVLVNILGKDLAEIFHEFEDTKPDLSLGSGDVKYHLGRTSTYNDIEGRNIELYLAPNPSHLEFVNPVVEGISRALQDFKHTSDRKEVLPVLIHGDAAFAGQGVVYETLNMSLVDGYHTGGSLHVIINNQVGFTTDPSDARSTSYCTDMGKSVQAPVFHVNCEDVESCCWAIKTAIDFRNKFAKDVIIDLYGYRKYGHNEGDDPSFTQPLAYSEIKEKPLISSIFATQLKEEGILSGNEDQGFTESYKKLFASTYDSISDYEFESPSGTFGTEPDLSFSTTVNRSDLTEIASSLVEYTNGFTVHPKLQKILQKRVDALEVGEGIDWGFAEGLAFGSLVKEGFAVRLSGQDCGRGTFSQRHLALIDREDGSKYFPLKRFEQEANGSFEVINSTLSEAGVVGFEFGYATVKDDALIIWEAQFGDFSNGAQVAIDQFIASSESKWNQNSNIVLMLPHGYEGQGPEHSSARLERYLQLCAENNMFVCHPTTGAQHFHMLRRHAYSEIKRPLIVMTPKSLLRLPQAASKTEELTDGNFHPIIAEDFGSNQRNAIFLSGKVYYDVKNHLEKEGKLEGVSLIRLEQLYPFSEETLSNLWTSHSFEKALWVQEEPRNMGAWSYVSEQFREKLGISLKYVGREPSASTAAGSSKMHAKELNLMMSSLLSFLE